MANHHSEKFVSSSELTTFSSPNRYPHPEISEDPIFLKFTPNLPDRSDRHLQDNGKNSETNNSSSMQFSTQQSMNFKKSFSNFFGKLSVPSTPLLLTNKLKSLQENSVSLRLHEKLKELEENISLRKSEQIKIEPLIDLDDLKYAPLHTEVAETHFIMEDEGNIEIPHLRWCAACKAEIATEIAYSNGSRTFWASVGIFMAGGIFGCFLLPYVTNYCKDIKIICHKCKRTLA